MAQTSKILTIDVNNDIYDIIAGKQGDANSRFLDVRVIDAGVPINLNRHTVRFSAVKPDGHRVYNNCVLTDALNGRFQVELTNQLLAVKGSIKAEFTLFGNNETQILTTKIFNIVVQENLFDETAVESTNEFGAVVILFQDVAEVRNIILKYLDVPVSSRATQASVNKVQATVDELMITKDIAYTVKSVQRGTTTLISESTNENTNITISSVVMNKSLVVVSSGYAGGYSTTTTYSATLTSSTNLRVSRIYGIGNLGILSGSYTVCWQVIEFY